MASGQTITAALKNIRPSDTGKLLFVFEGADRTKVQILEEDVDSYVFLLDAKGILPFDYPFRFNPLPHSQRLREDIYSLVQSQYLGKGPRLYITDTGHEWVENELNRHGVPPEVVIELGTHLKDIAKGGRENLFRLVYAEITR